MSPETERSPAPRRPAPLQRRLLLFAAAVLAPLIIGALTCGLVLQHAATRSQRLAEEMVSETQVSVSLFQGLQAARIAGSGYMEEGERDDLVAFRAAARQVDRALVKPVFDEAAERGRVRRVDRQWQAAVDQLEGTQTGVGSATRRRSRSGGCVRGTCQRSARQRRAARGRLGE